MATRGDPLHGLAGAVRAVRAAAAELSYPLPLPTAAPARAQQAAVLAQIDDYLLARLHRLDAPLLVVVGGSTGAGKSTLINSLVQAPVSPAGVLRPTTRAPVLACHPADLAWYRSGGPLGGLLRTPGPGPAPQLIAAPALRAGVAFVDAPDFDAVVEANRSIARRLLGAADLWLFVTTAARYADAVPWELLAEARRRGTVVAVVLDRVPQPAGASATVEIVAHLTELLTLYGLGTAPLFVVPESRVGGGGLLPEEVIAPLRTWFESLSGDLPARGALARYALDSALAALPPQLEALAAAAAEQIAAAETLAERVGMAYGGARATVEQTVWERALSPGVAAVAASEGGAVHVRPDRLSGLAPVSEERGRWESTLVTLVCGAAADAAEQAQTGWLEHPAGRAMIGQDLATPSVGLASKVARLARAWPGGPPAELLHRIGELLDTEAARWLDGLAGVPPDHGPAQRLREAAADLEHARLRAGLTVDPTAVSDHPAATPSQASAGEAGPAPGPPPAGSWPPEPSGTPKLDRAGR